MLSIRHHDEDPTTILEHLNYYFFHFTCAKPGLLKVAYMAGGSVLICAKFAAWVLDVEDGLDTDLGIALATTIAGAAIIDNFWGRFFAMYRREVNARNKKSAQAVDALDSWTYPGVDSGIVARAGYIQVQLGCAMYMANSVPGAFLNTFALTKLGARLVGTSFNPNCGEKDTSSTVSIVVAHGAAVDIARSSNSSFISYNWPQINRYYVELFINGEIWNIKNPITWLETLIGVGTNTIVIAFTGYHSLKLLQSATLCHLGINVISDELIRLWIYQACAVNFEMNGLMTLYAVNKRNTNQHEIDRTALARDINMSLEWAATLRTAIILNAVGAFLAVLLSITHTPGMYDPAYKDEDRDILLILIASLVATIGWLNQNALSSESDIYERVKRLEKIQQENSIEMQEKQALSNDLQLTLLKIEEEEKKTAQYDEKDNDDSILEISTASGYRDYNSIPRSNPELDSYFPKLSTFPAVNDPDILALVEENRFDIPRESNRSNPRGYRWH
jgi:hypothetical protein